MSNSKSITGTFFKEKETKNTIRFEESDDSFIMGTAYIQKRSLKELGNPDKIKITIEAA